MKKNMLNHFLLIIILIILSVVGIALVLTKKCVAYLDPQSGKTMGGGTAMQKNNFLNFYTEYLNLAPINVKVGEEKSFPQIPTLKIKLIDIKDDGRCPSDVDCGISGWATVLVEVSYNGAVERKELHISGGNSNVFRSPEELSNKLGSGNVVSVDQYKIYFVALNPYPISAKKIRNTEYEGIFLADTLKSLQFKKEIVGVAYNEIKKHIPDFDKYYATGILWQGGETFTDYIVNFTIPFGPTDNDISVRVQYINNQWKATEFNNQSLQQLVNKTVTLEGKAINYKAGAVLFVKEKPIYIEGLDSWPQDFIDKQLTLSGRLVLKMHIPAASTGESVRISQGGKGCNDYVLENAAIEMDKGDFGFKRLTEAASFPQGQHQEAIKAIIAELENKRENPKEFFAKFEPDPTASKLSFILIHQDSFKVKTLNAAGNPSGKDRKAIYDLIRKKVTFLFYQ